MVCRKTFLFPSRAFGNFLLQAKVRCEALEAQLVDLVISALERCEEEPDPATVAATSSNLDEADPSQLHWQHLSSQLIFFVLFQFASFSHMVLALYEKVNEECK